MAKVITDKNKINEALERGVEKVYPSKKALAERLATGKKIRLYCGFDPSARSLHIGNAIQINKLAQFQALGHEVIFLIGDFTGLIGDPTDKTAARKKLSREELLKNSENYQKQASAYLNFKGENPAKIMHNSQWGDKLTFKDLIEISANFTVQQMIQRDMFQERLKAEKPIYLHEFLYPLAQAYDSVAMNVDLEIGGNDQMFNMMCGRDLIKATSGKEKFVLTNKLLVDPTGKKMGKTEGNIVNLDETPENMYGQIMSWTDNLIGLGFELCTQVPMTEVKNIYQQLEGNKVNPRDLKMKLAYELVKIMHGTENANKAEENFITKFQKKDIPKEIEEVKLNKISNFKIEIKSLDGKTQDIVKNKNIVDLLIGTLMAESKSEARRLIKQKAIKIDGKVIDDPNYIIDVNFYVYIGKD
jgi:tyrosyl-tRNA synthetase